MSFERQGALGQAVELEPFEGPLDLLTTLVLREEIELLELPLADLVESALPDGAEDRWSTAVSAELTLLLASLAELKARRMLGEPADEEPREDATEVAERLAARLVALAPYQRAAEWLAARAEASSGHRYRRVPLPDAAVTAEDPALLREALEGLLVERPVLSVAHMTPRRVRVLEVMADLRARLADSGSVSFDAHVAGLDRLQVAATLLAALELCRLGEARLRQAAPFGDITISPSSP